MTLVTLTDDLHWESDKGSAFLLILLDLSVAFVTFSHGTLLYTVAGLESQDTLLQCFHSCQVGLTPKGGAGCLWHLCYGGL